MTKQLRVLHFPQIPCEPFIVEVKDLDEAQRVCHILANYDLFQYVEKIKPDYANVTEIQEFDTGENEWVTWYDETTGIGDINEYIEFRENKKRKVRK